MALSVGKMKTVAHSPLLPSFPSSLMEWVQPGAWGVITTLLAVNRLEIKASEARQAKRTDELRADMNRQMGDLMDELKASEARQAKRTDELRADMNRQMGDLRADNRSLGEKMDRMLDALLAARKM